MHHYTTVQKYLLRELEFEEKAQIQLERIQGWENRLLFPFDLLQHLKTV